jgi:hypothetical protein
MKKLILAIFIFSITAAAAFCLDFGKIYPKPRWYDKTSLAENGIVYAVGRSGQESSEQKAKDIALVNGVRQFLKYCRLSPETFGRIIEVYSKIPLSEYSKLDPGAKELFRAKLFTSKYVLIEWYTLALGEKFEASVLLKVPEGEFDGITAQRNTRISVDVFFYREDKNKMTLDFKEGSGFKPGDKYAIYLKPSDECYLYVYLMNDRGGASRLFPNLLYETESNPLPAGVGCWVPNGDWLLRLGDTKEKLYLYVITSLSPIAELEKENSEKLKKGNLDKLIKRAKLRPAVLLDKREIAAVVPPGKQGLGKVAVVKKLAGGGASIYKMSFFNTTR